MMELGVASDDCSWKQSLLRTVAKIACDEEIYLSLSRIAYTVKSLPVGAFCSACTHTYRNYLVLVSIQGRSVFLIMGSRSSVAFSRGVFFLGSYTSLSWFLWPLIHRHMHRCHHSHSLAIQVVPLSLAVQPEHTFPLGALFSCWVIRWDTGKVLSCADFPVVISALFL